MEIQNAKHLLKIIRDGYRVELKDDTLAISPSNSIDEQMAGLIRKYKAELLELLKSEV